MTKDEQRFLPKAYDDIERSKKDAQEIIASCEADLARKLSAGECRDLLMDNTTWSSDAVADVVRAIGRD